MKYLTNTLCATLFLLISFNINAQSKSAVALDKQVIPAAERMNVYVPMLKGKKVAVFANQTSMVKNTDLVDTMVKSGVNVVKIFGPEHGFRGDADAGEHVGDVID